MFRDLLDGQGFLAFAAFDILWLDGQDLRSQPLEERKRRLTDLLPADTGPLYKILTLEEHGRALFSAIGKIKNPGYSQGEDRGELFRRRSRPSRRPV